MGKIFWVPFLFSTVLLAQSERANLTGAVSDPSGAAIASVTVSVIHLDTNTTAIVRTTPGGDYNVPNLSPRRYRVEISAVGLKHFVPQQKISHQPRPGQACRGRVAP